VFAIDDTIVAIATAPGRGGIGVVRLSGPEAAAIAGRLLRRDEQLVARQATFARVFQPDSDQPLDQIVATWFESPHSYTGQDVVELSGHGSPVLLGRIVELAIDAGARLAEPGEFTLRAYLNGRLDLAQAEAVADLVNAVTPLQARAAMDQLEGTLTSVIGAIDASLFDLTARLEASLDFPDEGFHFVARDDTARELGAIEDRLVRLSEDGRVGRVVREGRTVAIVGRPNAGKSSLFNALAGAARAIVTDVPGTTRDLVTERVDIEGLAVTLVDTAGLRDARDAIEAEGIARARQAQRVAALTLIVLDGSAPLDPDDLSMIDIEAGGDGDWLVVRSKADLPAAWQELPGGRGVHAVAVSAVTGAGLTDLRQRLAAALTHRDDLRDTPMITNVRHLALVSTALDAVRLGREALGAGATEELVLAELTRARDALEEITGRRSTDDLLVHIFTRFCIGK
jgi:tRNA modification GTPase